MMSESFADLFEESLKSVEMKPRLHHFWVVVAIDNDFFTVNAGLKSRRIYSAESIYH